MPMEASLKKRAPKRKAPYPSADGKTWPAPHDRDGRPGLHNSRAEYSAGVRTCKRRS